jgi:hypothetical protein
MTFSGVLQRARKSAYRLFRYHWITERVQHVVRRNRRLKLTAINLELEVEPGSVFIDCGANVGGITSMFARAGATVHSSQIQCATIFCQNDLVLCPWFTASIGELWTGFAS